MNPSAKFATLFLCAAALAASGCSASAPPATPPAEKADVSAASPAPQVPAAQPVENAAPDFTLTGADGAAHSLAEYRGKWIVLEWTNAKCPFVRKHYDSGNMQALQSKYTQEGVVWLTICSSAPGKEGYQEPAGWKATIGREDSHATALLIDADGKVGRAYGAKTTPHMFVVDPRGAIVYRGAIDDKRSANKADVAGARNYVAETLDAGMAGRPAPVAETPSYG